MFYTCSNSASCTSFNELYATMLKSFWSSRCGLSCIWSIYSNGYSSSIIRPKWFDVAVPSIPSIFCASITYLIYILLNSSLFILCGSLWSYCNGGICKSLFDPEPPSRREPFESLCDAGVLTFSWVLLMDEDFWNLFYSVSLFMPSGCSSKINWLSVLSLIKFWGCESLNS